MTRLARIAASHDPLSVTTVEVLIHRGGLGLPACRHTAGTLLAKAGVPLWTIAGLLGHSMTKTTELYAHFSPEFGRDAVKILGRVTGWV